MYYTVAQLGEEESFTGIDNAAIYILQNVNLPVMDRAKTNVALLAVCQALSMTSVVVLFTVAALIGQKLATDPSLATLPLALMQLAVMLATIPASLLMKQKGRRFGFVVGTLIGIVGIALAVAAVLIQSFTLFCTGTILMGVFNGFSGFYRFAAADAADESFRAQAISLVVAGGVVAAVLGPNLASSLKDGLAAEFGGSLLSIIVLQVVVLALLPSIKIPPLTAAEKKARGRSLAKIMQQPIFIVAAMGSMVGYGIMALIMTATPLAMVAIPHPFHSAASVIQWHVLGMFAPSFFTGFLIARFGVLTIILGGVLLNLLAIAINLSGTTIAHFLIALTVLGIGWNFMFVGSTTLLTEAYAPAEKAQTQAIHDFLMFGFVTAATFLSGRLLNSVSWAAVNYAGVPFLLMMLAAVLWLQRQRRSTRGLSPLS